MWQWGCMLYMHLDSETHGRTSYWTVRLQSRVDTPTTQNGTNPGQRFWPVNTWGLGCSRALKTFMWSYLASFALVGAVRDEDRAACMVSQWASPTSNPYNGWSFCKTTCHSALLSTFIGNSLPGIVSRGCVEMTYGRHVISAITVMTSSVLPQLPFWA